MLNLVYPGETIRNDVARAWNVSCSECYLMFVAPCRESPHEGTKLRRVSPPCLCGLHSGICLRLSILVSFCTVLRSVEGLGSMLLLLGVLCVAVFLCETISLPWNGDVSVCPNLHLKHLG